MTGLDVENSHILEIACLITDENLVSMNDYLNIVIYQPREILENMTDWCKVQHKKVTIFFKQYNIFYRSVAIFHQCFVCV